MDLSSALPKANNNTSGVTFGVKRNALMLKKRQWGVLILTVLMCAVCHTFSYLEMIAAGDMFY